MKSRHTLMGLGLSVMMIMISMTAAAFINTTVPDAVHDYVETANIFIG